MERDKLLLREIKHARNSGYRCVCRLRPPFPKRGLLPFSGTRKPPVPCVSKQCPTDGVWRIGRGVSPDRVRKTRLTPSESSAGHGLPPQRAPKQSAANGVRMILWGFVSRHGLLDTVKKHMAVSLGSPTISTESPACIACLPYQEILCPQTPRVSRRKNFISRPAEFVANFSWHFLHPLCQEIEGRKSVKIFAIFSPHFSPMSAKHFARISLSVLFGKEIGAKRDTKWWPSKRCMFNSLWPSLQNLTQISSTYAISVCLGGFGPFPEGPARHLIASRQKFSLARKSFFLIVQLSDTGDSQRDSRESIRANHSQLKPLFL